MSRHLVPWFILLCVLAPLTAKADPAPSDSFNLARVQLADDYWPIAVGPNDTLYAYKPGQPRIYRSTDKGATWTIVYTNNTSPYFNRPVDLFVTAKGWVLYPTKYNPSQMTILKGNGSGALRAVDTLAYECPMSATYYPQFWHPVEDTVGIDKVYLGEYGGGFTDTCAFIWCGTWNGTGYTWALSNDATGGGKVGRHVHGMGIDPDTRWLYAMFGDRGAGYTNPEDGGYLMRKTLAGSWAARPQAKPSGWESQWLTIGFGNGRRILATDRGGPTETNFFAWTDDDSTYTIADSLANPIVPWAFGKGADGTQYVSTVNQSSATAANQILISRDHGASWKVVYEAALLSTTYMGFVGMTTKALSTGEMFYWIDKPGTADDATYRFTLESSVNKTNWLIGVGADCDFSSVAAATANVLVDDGDTLTLKANQTHRVGGGGGAIDEGMTICGQTGNRDDVLVVPITATTPCFSIVHPGVTLRDLTVRTKAAGVDTVTMSGALVSVVTDGAELTMRNMAFRDVRAGATSGGYGVCVNAAVDAEAGNIVRLVNVDVDSLLNSSSSTSRRGAFSFENIQRVVIDSCSVTNSSSRHAPVYYLLTDYAPSPAFDFKCMNSLFAKNTSASTSTGGAIRISLLVGDEENYVEAADVDTAIISHCTFYDNDVGTAANGQIMFTGEADATGINDFTLDHIIIVGDGADYAMSNPPGSLTLASATYCDSHNNSQNNLWATTETDSMRVDPEFVTVVTDSTRRFMPRNCTVGAGGSSVCVTDDASYMGYIQPYGTAVAPTLETPTVGYPSPLSTMVVGWFSAAYADSYQVRFGSTCGTGTTQAAVADTVDTLTVTPNAIYSWQVRSKDCVGWGPWGTCWTFGGRLARPVGHKYGHRWR